MGDAPTGTDPQYEQAAAAALLQLRQQYDAALQANGLNASNLQSTIDAGGSSLFGFFDTGGHAAIAKNLQSDGQRIDKLATVQKAWAESGQQDDGSDYDWGRWAAQADVIGSDLQANFNLAWDASVLGPIVDAAGATAVEIAADVGKVGDFAGGLLSSPWLYVGLAAVGVLLVFPTVRRLIP